MNKAKLIQTVIASTGLLGIAALALAEDIKPKINVPEVEAKITRDSSEVRTPSQPMSGYADVVQKILPSVVSIGTYSTKAPKRGLEFGENELDQIPPQFRQFFEDWMEKQGQGGGQRKRQQAPTVWDRSTGKWGRYVREPGHIEYAGKLGLGEYDKRKIKLKEFSVA